MRAMFRRWFHRKPKAASTWRPVTHIPDCLGEY